VTEGAAERNGLGIEPTRLPDGRLAFRVSEAARLLGVSRSTVENRTKLEADADAHLPSDEVALSDSQPRRWVLAEPVVAGRAELLALLGASEHLPESAETRAAPPSADAESRADGASSGSSGDAQERAAELQEQVRILEEERVSLLAARAEAVATDRTPQIAALEEEVRILRANMRDMLAVDEAKTDIIRRHLPVESLND
jgi:hypothetical protein